MQRFNADEIAGLMSVSDKIADLTYDRFQSWVTPFTKDNAKQAVLAFQGQALPSIGESGWVPFHQTSEKHPCDELFSTYLS